MTALLIIALAVAGYFGYRYFAAALDVPEELEPYTMIDSVRARVRSKTPAPASDARLDARWLALYIDGLDSTGRALLATRTVIDSMFQSARARGDTGITTLLTSPEFYRAVAIVGPATKRSLVGYLNTQGRSLEEYHWAKRHTLAATDITMQTADSMLHTMVGRYFGAVESNVTFGGKAIARWFESIDSLRASGAISAEEKALAMPMRTAILERGLGSLYGFDTDFGP